MPTHRKVAGVKTCHSLPPLEIMGLPLSFPVIVFFFAESIAYQSTPDQPDKLQSEAVDRFMFSASQVSRTPFPVYVSETNGDVLVVNDCLTPFSCFFARIFCLLSQTEDTSVDSVLPLYEVISS